MAIAIELKGDRFKMIVYEAKDGFRAIHIFRADGSIDILVLDHENDCKLFNFMLGELGE